MNLGRAFREIRVRQHKKQFEVAEAANITQTYLSQIESGDKIPTIGVAEKLCRIYRLPLTLVLWMGTDEKDIVKVKRGVYRQLKPVVDSLVNSFILIA